MKKSTKNLLVLTTFFFIIGGVTTLMGALAKLQHWSWAAHVLTTGIVLHAMSYLLGGFALIQSIGSKK